MDFNERSAYPHPDEFKVMRPEYVEQEDGDFQATITIAPFKVTGQSVSMPGARRAAIYEAAKTYRNYHPSYRIENPYPEAFMDTEGTKWKALSGMMKERNGDYAFYDADGEEDFADIEQMLMWDVRPAPVEVG
ncbi:MAG: hypothetical protein JJ896_03765 [Rhodothermales bacterium]|nr:hypothetical protein [Rhodothermales bacterium]MBO6778752.1 hypothetical protein [Rhodothermales bacterium]